ncbi:MAG: helix-turn-helix domain-containing protein [Lachnospiraceae bacterium]|nr:helix-turn-helix domain-containing protein [Lachnospiraceae bacterium]
MDQQKIGTFLKELRKEKNITQEQLAEKMCVSRRTVSRWETGYNMPDLDILIDIAEYYDVDLREILDGERKDEQMDKEMKETVLKVADFSKEQEAKVLKRIHIMFVVGLISALFFIVSIYVTDNSNPAPVWSFLQGLSLGIELGMIIVGVIMTSKYAKKIREFKYRLLHKAQ